MSATPQSPSEEDFVRYSTLAALHPRTMQERFDRIGAVVWLVEHGYASEWPPPAPEPPPRESYAPGNPTPEAVVAMREKEKARRRPKLDLTSMDFVEEEEIEWLWPGRIPLGALTTVMGKMGQGKSTLRDWLTSVVSGGHPWPDCPDDNPPGTVLVLQAEESTSRVIKHRLNAFAYGRGKVFVVNGTKCEDGAKSWFSIRTDVDLLAAKCDEIGDVRMVLIDPIGAYMRGTKGNNDLEIREFLQPLKDFAEDQDVAVVLLAHPNKNADKELLDRLNGSSAFGQIVRSMWYLSEDPRDKSRRLLSLMKENTPGTVKTAISLHYDDRKRVMTWFPAPVELSAQDVDNILQRDARIAKIKTRMGRPAKETKAAEDFLLNLLSIAPASLSVCREKALLLGIAFSTLRRGISALVERHAIAPYEVDSNGQTRIWFRSLDTPAGGGEAGPSQGASR